MCGVTNKVKEQTQGGRNILSGGVCWYVQRERVRETGVCMQVTQRATPSIALHLLDDTTVSVGR